jgi:hypothetical protein
VGYEKICFGRIADFATLDTEKLFSKFKSHELSLKCRPNHDASLTSKALITSACVGGHDTNPTNTISSTLEFALSSLAVASDEQYEGIPDDEIALLARKFCTLHKFHKERRRSPRGSFECGDTTHFITDCPKQKKFDSSNKYDYINWNDYNKGHKNKMNRFGDKKKKKFQKIMSQVCAALSDFDFSSDDSSSSEEDEKVKRKQGKFTGLCLMGKSSRNISDSDSDVSDDLSFESLSLRVLVVHKPNRIICKHTDANCSSFDLRVFVELSNPQGQRQTSTLSILRDNFGERKAKFNLEMSRTTQMQLYKCIHVP